MSRHVAVGGLIVFGTTISLFAKIGGWRREGGRGGGGGGGRQRESKT